MKQNISIAIIQQKSYGSNYTSSDISIRNPDIENGPHIKNSKNPLNPQITFIKFKKNKKLKTIDKNKSIITLNDLRTNSLIKYEY